MKLSITASLAFLPMSRVVQGCSIISLSPCTGVISLNEEDDFVMEDGPGMPHGHPNSEHARKLDEGSDLRRLTKWADSTLLPT